ncbi:unnamed protein product [Boreogadus saida]
MCSSSQVVRGHKSTPASITWVPDAVATGTTLEAPPGLYTCSVSFQPGLDTGRPAEIARVPGGGVGRGAVVDVQ